MSPPRTDHRTGSGYVELGVVSNFSFLRGASHPDELVSHAAKLGLAGLGLADRNTLAGVVRGHVALRDVAPDHPAFRYLVGVRLLFADATPDLLVYPQDRAAYGRLCALLTRGNRRTDKGNCTLYFDDLADHAEGQLFILMPEEADLAGNLAALEALARLAPGRVWLGAACRYLGRDRARLDALADLAGKARVPLIATNDVLYHAPERRPLQDTLTSIREHVTIFEAGKRLEQNAERHLKPPEEMVRLFRAHPQAIAETIRFAERIRFSLEDLRYNYPQETVGNGETAQQTLERLTWEGARKRYPGGIPFKVRRGVLTEFRLIAEKRYAPYFLTVADLMRFAREERGILCQGRGSAANSTVCFCLGITEVDPMVGNLVFGRFISTERDEPPDIDVDFEHERREEVIQYLYAKYGRHRAALTASVTTYRSRSAVREIGKVFGLSSDAIAALNGMSWGSSSTGLKENRVAQAGFDLSDPTLRRVFALVRALVGFPRHLSQHVGGFVLTGDRLDHSVPIANAAMAERTTIEWDKNDLDALGILKVDILALGMLSCIRRAFELMRVHYGRMLTLAEIMRDQDEQVYAMTRRADTIGVFQIESRAQMSMLPRLKPRSFYDLVIEVAIVRPGPIQGGMVHPYLKRRQNGVPAKEKLHPQLYAVLERTLGIPLFQEQAMQIAIVAGGFTPGEADQLRRAMATFRRAGTIGTFRDRLIGGMLQRGYERDFAERCFKQIEGFADYGFPESHAASFALLVYVSCWLKCHYPDVFACALMNAQPMGFYAPAQIVRDAREHGVEIRSVDINHSQIEHALEPGQRAADHLWERHREMAGDIHSTHALRLGLDQIKGMRRDDAGVIVARRGAGYDSVRDLWLRTGLETATLERLAEADAFRSLGLDRRAALWAVKGLKGSAGADTLPLFAAAEPARREEPDANLPPLPPGEDVIHDYRSLSLSLKAHPVSFLRARLRERGILTAAEVNTTTDGHMVHAAGLVLVRQRPGTASGVIFETVEDETGVVNVIVWPKVFEHYRRIVLGARFLCVRGPVQKEGLVVHVIARELYDYTPALLALANGEDIGSSALARASRRHAPNAAEPPSLLPGNGPHPTQPLLSALPSGRNFH
ncbi:MAG: error-prone DNA polymerase [Hyphomicrobiales bacterium]|nr:MAG: error-prone DNA polymerase [Hyphomicrobiales bacterium]